jgi:hypothetical protein
VTEKVFEVTEKAASASYEYTKKAIDVTVDGTKKVVDVTGKARDLIKEYLDDEYGMFPVCSHDDMLDCHARVLDPQLGAVFPKLQQDHPYAVSRPVDRVNSDYDVLTGATPAFA